MNNILLLILFSVIHNVVNITWVERSNDGDKFDVTCSTCHLYGATCQSWQIFSCCKTCKCSGDETIFNGLCRSDLSHKDLSCKFFTYDNQYYGLKTTTFFKSLTDVGYIYRDGEWSHTDFYKCEFSGNQQFWNTNSWVNLFTNGRTKDDFYFDDNLTGVMLKFFGSKSNHALYAGLLIKLNLECLSYFGGKEESCLIIKVAGKHFYDSSFVPTTTTTQVTMVTSTTETITTTETTTVLSTTNRPYMTSTATRHTTKAQTTKKVTAKPHHSPTSSTSKHKDKSVAEILKEVLPFVAAVFFVVFFCVLFLCCKVRRGKTAAKTLKIHLLATDHPSYSGDSSFEIHGELVTSSEFEVIQLPTYSDIDELKLGMLNERKRAPSGIYYVNAITSDDGKNDSINSAESEIIDQNQQSTSNKIFLVDGNT